MSSSFLPNVEIPVITFQGANAGTLTADSSQSAFFQYEVLQRANQINVRVGAVDFSPSGLNLSGNALAVADHFQSIWDAGGNATFAGIFADLDQLALNNPSDYAKLLTELSPGATLAFGARGLAMSQNFGNAVLNGPIFEGSTAEVPSSWARMYGRTASHNAKDGFSDFTSNNTIWQAASGKRLRIGLWGDPWAINTIG